MTKKLFLLIFFILFIPDVVAWNWFTHREFGENVYFSLPKLLQQKLDLNLLGNGTIAPDRDFRDNYQHHYPLSYNLSLHWLELAKKAIEKQDYKTAGYAFGVATHYISDSFSSPHYVKNESYSLHEAYEWQAKKIKTKCQKRSYDLQKELEEAAKSEQDWEEWLKTKDPELPQKRVEQAQELIFAIGLELFNAECKHETDYFPMIVGIISVIGLLMIIKAVLNKKIRIKI